MTNRRGVSLVELLVVISTGMIVVGLAVALVRTLVGAHRAAEAHLVRSDAGRRLCESFRSHVRAAGAAEYTEEDGVGRLELTFDDGHQVEFRSAEQVVTRTERDQGVERRREKYTLPANSAARFEVQSDNNTKTVKLAITQTPSRAADGALREFVAVATLNRDHRFVSKGK